MKHILGPITKQYFLGLILTKRKILKSIYRDSKGDYLGRKGDVLNFLRDTLILYQANGSQPLIALDFLC